MVDDDIDFFEHDRQERQGRAICPKGLTFSIENAPVGKTASGENKSKANHFARITKGEHEDMRDALKRLKEWVGHAPGRPATTRSASARSTSTTRRRTTFEEVGWRTYYLFSKAEITGDMVRDAQAAARSERAAASAAGTCAWR